MPQQRIHKVKDTSRNVETSTDQEVKKPVPSDTEQAQKRNAELDALCDEVDEVLIENAELFVAEYKQKGGE